MSDFDVLGTVGKLALPTFARFQIRGNPSLGSWDMVPRTEATGVFLVHRRAFFQSGFWLDSVKSRRSESCKSCTRVSSFQRTWARGSTCCEPGRLCAQARQRRRESLWKFQHSLISLTCFRARRSRSSRCWISTILVSPKSSCYVVSKGTGLAQWRAWVRRIWPCERRLLECSSSHGVFFWSKFRLDRRSS